MRLFLKKLVIFAALFFLMFVLFGELLMASFGVFQPTIVGRMPWRRPYERVHASMNMQVKSNLLILGDSTADQLFSFPYDDKGALVLSINGAILAIGHYILAYNVLERTDKIDNIVLMSVPNAISNPFERKRTHANFVEPFLDIKNIKHFSPLIHEKLSTQPLSYLYLIRATKMLPVSDIDFSGKLKEESYLLSDVSIEYLKKLDALCANRGVRLTLLSPPVPESRRKESDDWRIMRRQIKAEGLEKIFDGYFQSIQYLPDDYFRDKMHLKHIYNEAYHDIYIQMINSRLSGNAIP